MQDHIKLMTEICDELSATGERVSDEDRVVYLLASLPDSYSVLVAALEANTNVPTLANVREHLLHKKTKLKGKAVQEGTLAASFKRKPRCNFLINLATLSRSLKNMVSTRLQASWSMLKRKLKVWAFKVTITPDNEGRSSNSTCFFS